MSDIDGGGFVPRRFEDLSDLRFRAATGPHPKDPGATVLLLDLRKLEYTWGDQLVGPLWAAAADPDGDRATLGIVVSDVCREGLTSLPDTEMGEDFEAVLVESLEDALAALPRL